VGKGKPVPADSFKEEAIKALGVDSLHGKCLAYLNTQRMQFDKGSGVGRRF